MATDKAFQKAAGLDGGHTGGHISDIAGGISSHPANAPNEENPGETGVLMSGEESGEIAETSLSGRNRSRICDLLHVKPMGRDSEIPQHLTV